MAADPQGKLEANGTCHSDDEAESCPICLNTFRDQAVGTPESCAHYFCLDCILEWSKVRRLLSGLLSVRARLCPASCWVCSALLPAWGLGADSQPVLAPACAACSRVVGDAHYRGSRRGGLGPQGPAGLRCAVPCAVGVAGTVGRGGRQCRVPGACKERPRSLRVS